MCGQWASAARTSPAASDQTTSSTPRALHGTTLPGPSSAAFARRYHPVGRRAPRRSDGVGVVRASSSGPPGAEGYGAAVDLGLGLPLMNRDVDRATIDHWLAVADEAFASVVVGERIAFRNLELWTTAAAAAVLTRRCRILVQRVRSSPRTPRRWSPSRRRRSTCSAGAG